MSDSPHSSLISRLIGAFVCCALLPLMWVGDSHAQNGERRGFLWEVRKGKQTAWLFGTIHVGRPEFYPLPPSRLGPLKRADAIVLEADVSDSARAIAATQKYAQYAEGTPGLETRLTPELRQRVESLLSRNQLDPAPMMRMKPWMLANVLALFEAAQAGYVPALSVEAYLLRLAKTDNKPILEFEGIEQQFELYEKAPWATQISFLEEAVKAVESRGARRELNRIVQAWETADRGALERLLVEMRAQSSVGSRFTVDTILLGRHPQMVRRIETMMAGGKSHVFAVGALHLVGPQGLVELLRARGYTLTEL
ncbi:MAG TPA: TraB/GumN family protein [Burkholderiaceae bacterium]|nr:TraB/GumN family protein [Burkholderiaceae bacterium]